MIATTTPPLLANGADYAGVALDVPADEVGEWWIEAVDYPVGSPTTAGLFRVRGSDWPIFLKVVQSYVGARRPGRRPDGALPPLAGGHGGDGRTLAPRHRRLRPPPLGRDRRPDRRATVRD